MSYTPDPSRVPLMPADKAQEIAHSLKWLAESYAEAGMARHASQAERGSQWWLNYSLSLAVTPPRDPS